MTKITFIKMERFGITLTVEKNGRLCLLKK